MAGFSDVIGHDPVIQPLLTDFYQLNMCYAYWKSGTHKDRACFDVFFRKNPFNGEFTVFAGLEDVLRFLESYKFSDESLEYLNTIMPGAEPEFFDYLRALNCNDLEVYGIDEGTIVFPREPLVTVYGPLALAQLLETTILNLVNYSSLVATNAARIRNVSGEKVRLLEFGLRRAQGPNGGLSASKYSYVGGFNATSNLLAGKLYSIPVAGTLAHSFICSFEGDDELQTRTLKSKDGSLELDFVVLAKKSLDLILDNITLKINKSTLSKGELLAFCSYAIASPNGFLALIDTYDTLKSGVINFCAVALALHELGYRPLGVRIDSGDLAYLSKEVRAFFVKVSQLSSPQLEWMKTLIIVASNDLNEDTIISLNEQGHEINAFGVGTHLVTCQKQPALGCVYKLVTKLDEPRIKLSQEVTKVSIPGRKRTFRLYSRAGHALVDLMQLYHEPAPKPNEPILCRHPFRGSQRAIVKPSKVMELQKCFWKNGRICEELPNLEVIRQNVSKNMKELREDHKRVLNPTPYKISLSEQLYEYLHSLWLEHAPIGQLE